MGVLTAVAVLVAAIGLTALFGWLGARPVKLMSAPRLVPYRILMLFTFALSVVMVAYLLAQLKSS
ncbi:MAG: hypothetical protein JSR86_13840 [Proteobacteria bacterium]|nr:hypothetical protein [Pseudomonadota bacterium]